MEVVGKLRTHIDTTRTKRSNLRPILSKSNRESPRKHYFKEDKIEAVRYFAHLLSNNSVETVKSKPFLEKLVIISVSPVFPFF